MTAPVTDLTLTQNGAGDNLGTLTWDHDGIDLDRFMLGFKRPTDTEWTNQEPLPAATFGAGPYETEVILTSNILWRVLAVETDGSISA